MPFPCTTFMFHNGIRTGDPIGANCFAIGTPAVYIWVDEESRKPVYVGEYGKSVTYDLGARLEYSIGARNHNTLNQLQANAQITGYDVSREMRVIAFSLRDGTSDGIRKSIEAWLDWLITVVHHSCHEQYCGFSYTVPNPADLTDAREMYAQLSNYLWPAPARLTASTEPNSSSPTSVAEGVA